MKVKSEGEAAQSCPTLSDPMDCSLPGSTVHGIFPGKSTGVGCHRVADFYSLKTKKIPPGRMALGDWLGCYEGESEVAQVVADPQRPHGLQPTRLLRPWDFPGNLDAHQQMNG